MHLFITGTDTGIGKTYISAGLVRALRAVGRDTVAIKPIASGFDDGINADIALLHAANGGAIDVRAINVYGFDPPIAPHRAAELAGVEIALAPITDAFERIRDRHQDVLVEGVGGVAVPLSPTLMLTDLMRALALPVVLVVGVRLGCINHALLSAAAIRAAGLTLAGWIANAVDPTMDQPQASIDAIAARIGAPLLGQISHGGAAAEFAVLAGELIARQS